MNKDGLCKVDAGNLGTCDDEAHNLNECSICSRVCVSFLSDIFCMNFKISHVNDYCICIQNCMWHCSVWSSELWYADLLQVCPQLRHHPIWQVPPGRLTDLMPQGTNPNNRYQSISIVLREHIIGFNFFNFWKKNTIIANLHKPLQ